MKTAVFLSTIAAAAAFAPSPQIGKTTNVEATKADLEAIAEKANPVVKFYDPLNLAEQDFYGFGNEATIGWLRHSEIKVSLIVMIQKGLWRNYSHCCSPARTHCHVCFRWIHCPIELCFPMATNACWNTPSFH